MPQCDFCKEYSTWTLMIVRDKKYFHPDCWTKKQKQKVARE